MTVPVSNIPVSIDYTSRDYYALREALIKRVQDRTGGKWAGNDPSDFGVALIEAFAYMGDLINYYIDRVANESYLGTATQKQNVLNLASMLGYTAGGYTSATVNLTLTTTEGYKGQIGASQLTSGTAKLVIPNDNSFAVGDLINVSGLSRSEYNGTFVITNKDLGTNEVAYVPASFTVTATADGSKITYTTNAVHNFKVGQIITVTGFSGGSSGYNVTAATITDVPSTTTFKVGTTLSGTATGSGTVVYADIATSAGVVGFVHSVGYTTVPEGTQISCEVTTNGVVSLIIFTTLAKVLIPFVNDNGTSGSQTVMARHGINVATLPNNQINPLFSPDMAGELLGYSTGEADQMFSLLETEVDTSTIKVFVETGNVFQEWTLTQHLEDGAATDTIFQIVTDSNDNVFIQFGDGIGGKIPTKDARIKATYLKGAGLLGNIPASSPLSIYDIPGATTSTKTLVMSKVSVSNTYAASGGDIPESLDSIRKNAPKALRALNRAVTLEDFENLALAIPLVGKSKAVASTPTSISLYIAPERSATSTELTPGITSTGVATSDLQLLQGEVATYMSDKMQIGATLTLLNPTYTYVHLDLTYTKTPGYSDDAVKAAIKSLIITNYSYSNANFADVINPQLIEKDVRALAEVENVQVSALYRHGGSGKNTLAGLSNEIFVFIGDYITLTGANPESRLASSSGLVVTSGGSSVTISPTYNQNVYVYSASTSNSTVVVTPTGATSGQTITVKDMATTSGSSQTITLSSGNNTIPIAVTAPDGITTSTYTLTVVKP